MKIIQQFLQRPWLYFILVLIGVSLKFYKLENRFFWYDEICTIEHTSGNQKFDISVNEIKNISFYSDQLSLKKKKNPIGSELKGLFSSTNLNPLHYTFLMLWYRIIGDDAIHYRLFSVFIFILTLPFLFLFARRLFKSDLAGWIAICLYSFSPYYHYFAQEARYYILWAFLIILLHYLFLIAYSDNKIKWWIAYTLIGILNLYASVLSGLVIISHFIYILLMRKNRWLVFTISAFLIFLAYLPWLISIINNRSEIVTALAWHSQLGKELNIFSLLFIQLLFMAASFIGGFNTLLGILLSSNLQGNYIQISITILLTALIIYSIIYVIKKLPKDKSTFLILILLPQLIFFVVSDIIRNTGGSLFYRYNVITFIGILFFLIYVISRKIELGKVLYFVFFLGIIVFGFYTIHNDSNNRCWNTPFFCEEILKEAQIISSHERQLLILDYSKITGINFEGFLTIVNECKSENIDILLATPDIKNVEEIISGENYSSIYLSYTSNELLENLKSQFGDNIDSLELQGILPTWRINIE